MSQTGDILNRLYAAEAAGVVRYLASARPVGRAAAARLLRDVRRMAAAAGEQMDRLDAALDDLGETRHAARPPLSLTSVHDVSVDFLLPRLIEAKRSLAQTYDTAAAEAAGVAPPGILNLIRTGAARHRGDFALLESYRAPAHTLSPPPPPNV